MEKRLDEILKIALDYDVTDIHFNYDSHDDKKIVIEMRHKGEMRQLKPHPDDIRLFRYLMYRANLDVSNVFQPQTGSFEEMVGNNMLSLRFAIVSSYHMTSGVLRILNNHPQLHIPQLTFQPDVISWLGNITEHRYGLFVFSGPTGSGKTTALYTILNECRGKKIFTLEDPVEVVNEKYVQLQINEKQNLSYADGIKQLMRHDPDILMIGEIRDSVAAKMAIRCALTGHLVVTSLHSSDCVSAIHRLEELGVDEFQLRDVLFGISNQRLYETKEGIKTAVFEVMNRKEVKYYFEHKHVSESFSDIVSEIEKTVSAGIIDEKQAKADLIG